MKVCTVFTLRPHQGMLTSIYCVVINCTLYVSIGTLESDLLSQGTNQMDISYLLRLDSTSPDGQ